MEPIIYAKMPINKIPINKIKSFGQGGSKIGQEKRGKLRRLALH
jgi:hypothetical protein